MPDNYKGIVRRLVDEVWTGGQLEALDELIHPEAQPPHGPWELPSGPEGFRRFVAMIRTSFPDLTRSVEDMVAEGDRLVLYYRLHGKHTGAGGFVPYPPTGEIWDMLGATAFRFADGKIIEEPWAINTIAAMLSSVAKANMRRMFESVWNDRNADDIPKYYAPDFLYHGPGGQEFQGHDGIRQFLAELKDGTPEARFVIEDEVSEGDTVLTRWRLTRDGRNAKSGMSQIRFAGGLAAEEWETQG